ncbi:hypothetical protein [Kitasatospora sp. NPDC004289]
MTTIDITGLDKAAVLAALYNASQQQGLGFLNPRGAAPIAVEQAQELIEQAGDRLEFDYVHGRALKVDISGDSFSPRGFDRDNGPGAARAALAGLLAVAAAGS